MSVQIIYFQRRSSDREDFIEDKVQLEAAIMSGLPVSRGNYEEPYGNKNILIGHGTPRSFGNPLWPDVGQISIVNKYWQSAAFKSFAQRQFTLSTFEPETIAEAAKKLGGDIIVKYANAQKVTPLCRLSNEADLISQLYDFYEYEFARIGGEDRTAIVQQFVSMNYEYRIFVVDGQPITGAGCIEEFTPLENRIDDFDDRVQKRRNVSPTEPRSDVSEKYQHASREVICPLFKKEGFSDYVLDLFLTDDGQVGVIELNPIHKSGMYAINYDALFAAILKRIEPASGNEINE